MDYTVEKVGFRKWQWQVTWKNNTYARGNETSRKKAYLEVMTVLFEEVRHLETLCEFLNDASQRDPKAVAGETRFVRTLGWCKFESGYTNGVIPVKPGSETEANVYLSRIYEGDHEGEQLFMLDIDHPCELVASKTPGHYHLYVDVRCSEDAYMTALKALVDCKIVDAGWYMAAKRYGTSVLRLPGVEHEFNRLKREIEESGNLFPRALPG